MDTDKLRSQMQSAMSVLNDDLSSIRTGRSSSALVENIVISAYGGAQRLKVMELASINSQDPTSLTIEPWDKQVIGEISKGIQAANVGLNPSIDGEIIRIVIPPMTGEDREKFVKILNTKLENARIQIRQIRGEEMKRVKSSKEIGDISEDDMHMKEKDIQKVTDEFNKKIDEVGERKQKELLQV